MTYGEVINIVVGIISKIHSSVSEIATWNRINVRRG